MMTTTPKTETQALIDAKRKQREEARRKVRALESEVVAALAGGTLLGLRNLVDNRDGLPWYGARLRGKTDTKFQWSEDKEKFACLDATGHLVVAVCPDDADEVRTHPLPDEDIRIEDLDLFARCLTEVLARHVASKQAASLPNIDAIRALLVRVIAHVTGERPL